MRRIVRHVEIDRDATAALADASAMAIDDELAEGLAQTVQLTSRDLVLEARERGLRGQGLFSDRLQSDQQPMDRIGLQPRRVVGVGIAAGQAVDALGEQLAQFVAPPCPAVAVRANSATDGRSVRAARRPPSTGWRRRRRRRWGDRNAPSVICTLQVRE